MIGIALVVVWASLVAGYLVRQQLRGVLAEQRRDVPPLPWRGPSARPVAGFAWKDRAA